MMDTGFHSPKYRLHVECAVTDHNCCTEKDINIIAAYNLSKNEILFCFYPSPIGNSPFQSFTGSQETFLCFGRFLDDIASDIREMFEIIFEISRFTLDGSTLKSRSTNSRTLRKITNSVYQKKMNYRSVQLPISTYTDSPGF